MGHTGFSTSAPPVQLIAGLADRYNLDRELGRGGMAVVYRARDLRHDRAVAIKILEPRVAALLGPERFLLEIRLTASLQHPNILPLLDSGALGDSLYLVTPFVEGGSLRQRLEAEGCLQLGEALAIVAAVAQGLEYAHHRGIVHRDIKPENILIQSGVPLLADFGIALPIAGAPGARITEAGVAPGTPEYMSPEQITGDRPLDGRTDQYSLACTLFELLAGRPPFTGPTAAAALMRRFAQPSPLLHSPHGSLPRSVPDAINRALALEPRERFPTVTEFVAALQTGTTEGAVTGAAPSLLVLPFANLSPDPDSEYFSDGLTEEIIADLSMIRSLRVISRTSAFRLKGTPKDPRTIGRELDVRYLLEGSVRRAGDQVRVTAKLIDTATDEPVWADKYGGDMSDIFAIQERLSRRIAEALRLTLTPEQARRMADRPLADPRAHDCYLRVRHEAWSFTPEAGAAAIRHARNGLALVGDNDLLYAALGQVHFMRANAALGELGEELAAAEAAARQALALAADSPAGLALLGAIQLRRGEIQRAVRTLKEALLHDPTSTEALFWLAYAYISTGHGALARTLVQRLLELDPLTAINHCLLGWIEAYEGRCAEALPYYRRMWELDPLSPLSRFLYALVLLWNERRQEARQLFDDLGRDPAPTVWTRLGGLFGAALGSEPGTALAFVDPALLEMAEWQDFFALRLAEAYALLGHRETSLRWLRRAIELGILAPHFHGQVNPAFASLRHDPEFVALLAEAAGRAALLQP
jgi:eukaryotic-like serine/threonine-protein kinase